MPISIEALPETPYTKGSRPRDIRLRGGHIIGLEAPTFVIAEAGVNHNGSIDLARELIAAAKQAGADCVKFQTFKSEQVASEGAPKAEYQLARTDRTESQIEMLRKLELDENAYGDLISYCGELGILFSSTPYSHEDIALLDALNVPILKAASIHCAEPGFLRRMAQTHRPIILSTGMANWEEVDLAVKTILDTGNEQLVVLQCTTNYPSPISDANLRVICAMQERYPCHIGYSDHAENSHIPCLAAVALGARVVERHLTVAKDLPGPDHSSSDTPEMFGDLVTAIREVEAALGSPVKQPNEAERANMPGMRRSIFAARDISAGKVIEEDDLICKRPADGIRPSQWDTVLGRKAVQAIPAGTRLAWEDLDG